MSTYISTTEHAAQIRAALKAKGWNSRKVSVRADSFSMGSSIDVTIRDITIPLSVVKDIAEAHERIDRCSVTGDILSGCNRYIHVRYDYKVVEDAAKAYLPAVEAAFAQVRDNYLIPVEGVPFMVGKRGNYPTLWANDEVGRYITEYNTLTGVAEAIASRMADVQAKQSAA
jgi:hypothetical protein